MRVVWLHTMHEMHVRNTLCRTCDMGVVCYDLTRVRETCELFVGAVSRVCCLIQRRVTRVCSIDARWHDKVLCDRK